MFVEARHDVGRKHQKHCGDIPVFRQRTSICGRSSCPSKTGDSPFVGAPDSITTKVAPSIPKGTSRLCCAIACYPCVGPSQTSMVLRLRIERLRFLIEGEMYIPCWHREAGGCNRMKRAFAKYRLFWLRPEVSCGRLVTIF